VRSGPHIVVAFLAGFSKSSLIAMRNYSRNILVATALLIGGCDHELSLEWPSSAPIEVNDRASHHQYTLAPDSQEYRKLRQWVDMNRSGWSRYPITAPICGVCVSAGDVQLNFLGSGVIAFTLEGMWRKSVAPSDYAYLQQ
jgi:hypothetical protein